MRKTALLLAMAMMLISLLFAAGCGNRHENFTTIRVADKSDWMQLVRFPVIKGKLTAKDVDALRLHREINKEAYVTGIFAGQFDKEGCPLVAIKPLKAGDIVWADEDGIARYQEDCGNRIVNPDRTVRLPASYVTPVTPTPAPGGPAVSAPSPIPAPSPAPSQTPPPPTDQELDEADGFWAGLPSWWPLIALILLALLIAGLAWLARRNRRRISRGIRRHERDMHPTGRPCPGEHPATTEAGSGTTRVVPAAVVTGLEAPAPGSAAIPSSATTTGQPGHEAPPPPNASGEWDWRVLVSAKDENIHVEAEGAQLLDARKKGGIVIADLELKP